MGGGRNLKELRPFSFSGLLNPRGQEINAESRIAAVIVINPSDHLAILIKPDMRANNVLRPASVWVPVSRRIKRRNRRIIEVAGLLKRIQRAKLVANGLVTAW